MARPRHGSLGRRRCTPDAKGRGSLYKRPRPTTNGGMEVHGRSAKLTLAAVAVACCALLIGATRAPAGAAGSAVTVQALRVNTLTDPIGLGDPAPNLSWRLSAGRQTAYEVRVASSAAQLDHPDLWDSGKVASSDTSNVVYSGAPLSSRAAVVWDVRVWDGAGAASDWSAPASWEMGL